VNTELRPNAAAILRVLLAVAVVVSFAAASDAQWLKQPTRGIPRTKDGKPNLKARAPRVDGHPDLTGLWAADPEGYGFNIASDLKPGEVLPWADEVYQRRSLEFATDHPSMRCLPDIGPFTSFGMFKIVQTRDVTTVLPESGRYRQIHTDGRVLPNDPQPTWMGYSIGRWDGDTFVVESDGFNDRTWLDYGGHPHTERLHVTERFRRTDFGSMKVAITIDDPGAYARPWTIVFEAHYVPDTELLEYVCNENEKSSQRFLVSERDRTTITLPAGVLQEHAGEYVLRTPRGGTQNYVVTVSGSRLLMKPEGAAAYEAIPLADGTFGAGGTVVRFARDAANTVSGFTILTVEGDLSGTRKK
jgi:hypothetical protein